jgi:hypothetical protein
VVDNGLPEVSIRQHKDAVKQDKLAKIIHAFQVLSSECELPSGMIWEEEGTEIQELGDVTAEASARGV